MEWIVLFIISWIVFLLLARWKELRTNVWGGVVAVLLQLAVDSNAMNHRLYAIRNGGLVVWGSSLFFVLGPVFTIGILLAQTHSPTRGKAVVNVLVLAVLYTAQELLLLSRKALEYNNWNLLDSAVVNLAAMIIISWFSIVVLNKMRRGTY